MDLQYGLRTNYPLTQPISLTVTTVGDLTALIEALKSYGEKLSVESNEPRAENLYLMALELVDTAMANGWNCGDPNCTDCQSKPDVRQQDNAVGKSPIFIDPTDSQGDISFDDMLAGLLKLPKPPSYEGD